MVGIRCLTPIVVDWVLFIDGCVFEHLKDLSTATFDCLFGRGNGVTQSMNEPVGLLRQLLCKYYVVWGKARHVCCAHILSIYEQGG